MKKILLALLCASLSSACSSGPAVKKQEYAKLRTERTFETDMPAVWKGVEKAVESFKVTERDPEKLNPIELRKTKEVSLETDWIYSRSRDKYHEYKVNDLPRKQFLQMRIRYFVKAAQVMGGVTVSVKTEEEIERLNSDGSPDGYSSVDEPDSARANELLEKVSLAILSAAPPSKPQTRSLQPAVLCCPIRFCRRIFSFFPSTGRLFFRPSSPQCSSASPEWWP